MEHENAELLVQEKLSEFVVDSNAFNLYVVHGMAVSIGQCYDDGLNQ